MTSYLTAGQKALIETALHLRCDELERRIRERSGTRVEHAREMLTQDDDDAPQHSSDREIDLAVVDAEETEYREILEALGRLKDDDFGMCQDCGTHIPFDRLRLLPHARYCVACTRAREVRDAPAAQRAL